jgi:hypothetical protein
MLSSFLDSIKQQFGTKSYWLASMLPLVLFLAANVLVLYGHSPDIVNWLSKVEGLEQKTLLYSALTATLLALAYVLSIMSSLMLEGLEGKVGPFRWMSGLLYARQWRALRSIDKHYQSAADLQGDIEHKKGNWEKILARNLYEGQMAPELLRHKPALWHFRTAGRKMAVIRFRHRYGWCIKAKQLQEAVEPLAKALAQNEAGHEDLLSNALKDLQTAITYALDRYQFEIRRLSHLRQINFPGVSPSAKEQPEGPTANNILAPTAMGNIGRAMATYTLKRYQLDLDIFWTRLQNSLQKDAKEYYSILQDTKVQVDCAVTLFWLSLLFTLFWTTALQWWFLDVTVREFLIVGISGTVSVVGCYQLACQSYRIFADVMRSSVDLLRFQVLQALHIPLPSGSEEERNLWLRLGNATGFGNPEGIQFKH